MIVVTRKPTPMATPQPPIFTTFGLTCSAEIGNCPSLGISVNQRALLRVLAERTAAPGASVTISTHDLHEIIGVSVPVIFQGIRVLREKGYLAYISGGGGLRMNCYTLAPALFEALGMQVQEGGAQ